jgi:PleD family two-component response regulator
MLDKTQTIRKPLILVAANDQKQRKLMWSALEAFGFRILTADDGASACDLFIKTAPDVVLLDLSGSSPDGFAVCKSIRGHVSGSETPIFIITERDDEDAIERAYRTGATDIIFKPIALPNCTFTKRLEGSYSCHPRPHICR